MDDETLIRIPKDLSLIFRVRKEEVEKYVRKLIALELFRENKVSLGKAAEIAGISKSEMMILLFERKIPIHYSVFDLEEDIKNLENL